MSPTLGITLQCIPLSRALVQLLLACHCLFPRIPFPLLQHAHHALSMLLYTGRHGHSPVRPWRIHWCTPGPPAMQFCGCCTMVADYVNGGALDAAPIHCGAGGWRVALGPCQGLKVAEGAHVIGGMCRRGQQDVMLQVAVTDVVCNLRAQQRSFNHLNTALVRVLHSYPLIMSSNPACGSEWA